MPDFIGRHKELALLDDQLSRAKSGNGSFVWIFGRRRVGKSFLVQEFMQRNNLKNLYFLAPQRQSSLPDFIEALRSSSLPVAQLIDRGIEPTTWRAALELAATGATPSDPLVIVIDEFPYLHAYDEGIDADFQAIWEVYQRLPILLICVGSDLSMMERLLEHDRPLHGRPTSQIRIDVLNPAEIADLLELNPIDALDAYMVVGGFPSVAQEWRKGSTRKQFLKSALNSSSTPLITNGERILNAELVGELNARAVLEAIGVGERKFGDISRKANVQAPTLVRTLDTLIEKGLIERLTPLAIPPNSKEARYVVRDSGLRFWLRFIGPHINELEMGRNHIVIDRIERHWNEYRGKSIEPIIREALFRILPHSQFGNAKYVGGYWTRNNNPEIDLVGADDLSKPQELSFIGAIKWRESKEFSDSDAFELLSHRMKLPGATSDTLLVGVSRTEFATNHLDVQLGPEDIIKAFRPRA